MELIESIEHWLRIAGFCIAAILFLLSLIIFLGYLCFKFFKKGKGHKFYPHKGLRVEALKGGIEYNTYGDLKKIVNKMFYPGRVKLTSLLIYDKHYTHLVTLNDNAIGYVCEGEKK